MRVLLIAAFLTLILAATASAQCDTCGEGRCCFLPNCEYSEFWCYYGGAPSGMWPCTPVGERCPYDGCGGFSCGGLSPSNEAASTALLSSSPVRVHSFRIIERLSREAETSERPKKQPAAETRAAAYAEPQKRDDR